MKSDPDLCGFSVLNGRIEMDSVLNVLKASWGYISYPLFEISGTKISVISVFLCVAFFALSLRLANAAERVIENCLQIKILIQELWALSLASLVMLS